MYIFAGKGLADTEILQKITSPEKEESEIILKERTEGRGEKSCTAGEAALRGNL